MAPPPPPSPILPHDPSDQDVSLFGSRVQFDGLGVVFDTSPTQPLFSRSDKRNWDPSLMTDQHHGVGAAGGVVSGIMDDGTGKFLEPQDRLMSTGEEAAYLERAIGECEGELASLPILCVFPAHAADTRSRLSQRQWTLVGSNQLHQQHGPREQISPPSSRSALISAVIRLISISLLTLPSPKPGATMRTTASCCRA